MQLLRFLPEDVLFFRDTRPADPGNVMEPTFPLPSVFFGSLRTHYLYSSGVSPDRFKATTPPDSQREALVSIIGEAVPEPAKGSLRILGPFLTWLDTLYLPVPANFHVQTSTRAPIAALPANQALISDIEEPADLQPLALPRDDEGYEPLQGWVSVDQWARLLVEGFLPGRLSIDEILPETAFYEPEVRFGHQRDRERGTVRTSMLYRATFQRFREDPREIGRRSRGYAVLADGMPGNGTGLAERALTGGEHRLCYLTSEAWSTPFDDAFKDRLVEAFEGRFFLYLASPAYFERGWFPDPARLGGLYPVAAAVGKPILKSGWDYARHRPKAMERLVPAGAVYFYTVELSEESRQSFRQLLDLYLLNSSVSDGSEGLRKAGFGAALLGLWGDFL